MNTSCFTCRQDDRFCPGHFGHITLPTPAYHPMFFSHMLSLLNGTCIYCHHFRSPEALNYRTLKKLELLDKGLIDQAHMLDNLTSTDLSGNDLFNDDVGEEDFTHSDNRQVRKFCRQFEHVPVQNHRANTMIQNSERRHVISSFFETFKKSFICHRCNAAGSRIIHEGRLKVYRQKESQQARAKNISSGLVMPDVLLDVVEKNDNTPQQSLRELAKQSEQSAEKRYLTSFEALCHLRRLFRNERKLIAKIYNTQQLTKQTTADSFFLQKILVPPNRFRPINRIGRLRLEEASQNSQLRSILEAVQRANDCRVQYEHAVNEQDSENQAVLSTLKTNFVNSLAQLQDRVNRLIDSVSIKRQGASSSEGIRQMLEKKEGLFRKHMMGKRVNYAARSVISPDINIETNEIGVPPVFATKLTYPEPVTPHNVHALRAAIVNGPLVWPGAAYIENEDGKLVNLEYASYQRRTALADQLLTPSTQAAAQLSGGLRKNKKVYRHLQNGDIVLMNRQPTLHKPSLMAHFVRVLPGEKTLRLHYANCNSYNADFDGDEMNLHVPQNEASRSEAINLAVTDNQYLVPTSGEPLRGLIQDHVVSGVWLTNKDTFFNREDYMQLIYGSMKAERADIYQPRIITLAPTIIKPVPRWSGKQLIATILENIKPQNVPGLTLDSKSKVGSKYWGSKSEEDFVLFDAGYMVSGILDKSQFGASANGLIHSVHEAYDATVAERFLSALGRLFTKYLQMRAFTCRMDDLILTIEGDSWRKDLLEEGRNFGKNAALEFTSAKENNLEERLEEVLRDDEKLQGLDATMKSKMNALTSSIIGKCLPDGLYMKFPQNHMQTMTISGAKGSNVNVSQISCCLGNNA